MKIRNLAKWAAAAAAAAGGASFVFWRKAVLRVQNPNRFRDQTAKPGSHWETTLPYIRARLEWLQAQKKEQVSIQSFDGLKLSGIFLPAETKSDKVVIAVHGYTSCGDNEYAAMSYFFHENGYHVLLVDDRAHGVSEGKYVGYGCLDREDCCKWARYIHDKFEGACSIYLHGISMGASTVLMASSLNLPSTVKGIIADCGYTSPWDELKYQLQYKYHVPYFPILPIASWINQFIVGYSFREYDASKEAARTKLPIFIIHGEKDKYVPVSMGKKIYESCKSRKQLWIVKGAGHAQSYYIARPEYEQRVLDFLKSL